MKKILTVLALIITIGVKGQVSSDPLIDTTFGGYHWQVTIEPPSNIKRDFKGVDIIPLNFNNCGITSCKIILQAYYNNDSSAMPMRNNTFELYATASEVITYQANLISMGVVFHNSYEADYYLLGLMMQKANDLIDWKNAVYKYTGIPLK